ncbi:MAG: peptidylprolyl isomerase [Spirochaetia bacterium]
MKRLLRGIVPLFIVCATIACAPATVSNKKMVSVDYKGTLADGTVFSQSDEGKPLEFLVGGGTIIPTLEKGMMGMKVGDQKKIDVKAADAYGEYDKAAVQEVPKEQFPKDLTLAVGQRYQVQTQSGALVVTITAIKDKTVTVDFNHPLAGKDLTFDVKVVKIRDATKEELAKAQPVAPQASPR